MLCLTGANAETVKYALAEGDAFVSGQTVEVKSGDAVVATITYGESGGDAFKSAKAYTGVEGYTAYTEGNGVNGNKTGGTFYIITPKVDAKITVAVCLNANRAFFIKEDGVALEDYDGITVDAKYYGTYEFEAKANKAYMVYCAGSKLGFFGFEMTFGAAGEQPVATTKTIFLEPEVWAVDGARFAAYVWTGETEQWIDFVEVIDGLYATQIPASFTGMVLVRLNGETTENNWDNKWNQTNDIDLTEVEDQTLFIILDFGEGGENSTCVSVTLAEIKDGMQTIIDELKEFNISELQDIITATEAVLNAEDLSLASLAAANQELAAAANTALKALLQEVVNMADLMKSETLSEVIADAQEALADEEISTGELVEVLKDIMEEVKPLALDLLESAMKFAGRFISDELTADNLISFIRQAAVQLQSGDISAAYATIKEMTPTAMQAAQDVMEKLAGYADVMSNADLSAAVQKTLTDLANKDFMAVISDMKAIVLAFVSAANEYVATIKALGITDAEELLAALSVAEQKVNPENNATIIEIGEAILQLIKAYRAYEEANTVYTVAGAFVGAIENSAEEASFFGETWAPAREDNDMVKGEDGLYTKTYEGVDLEAGTIYYKVVANHSWDLNWGFNGNNADYVVNEAGQYNITFIFNPAKVLENGFNVTCELVKLTPDGINSIATDAQKGNVYNLNGQKVMKTQKGLYIINGKKTLVK